MKIKTRLSYLFLIWYEDNSTYVAIDRCDFEKARQAVQSVDMEPPMRIDFIGEVMVEDGDF